MIILLLFAFALASDQHRVVLPSGRVVCTFKPKSYRNTQAKQIRDKVANVMNIRHPSLVMLMDDKEKMLENDDVVDAIETITAVIQNNDDTVAVVEPRTRNFQDALALVRNGATGAANIARAYPYFVATMADGISNDDYGRGASCCLIAAGLPIGIIFVIFLSFHATLFGKFEWELNRDALNNVCKRFKVNTDHLDKGNDWDSYVTQFCKDGWETRYTRSQYYIGLCYGKKGASSCMKSKQVPDDLKNAARTSTLIRRGYDSSRIADEQIVETDALVQERNEKFKKKDNRELAKLNEIKEAEYRLKTKYRILAQRNENARKRLKQKSKWKK